MAKAAQPGSERLFVRRVLIILALASCVYLLWQLRSLLLMLFGAIVIATIFRALADKLQKWTRLPDAAAVLLSVILVLGGLATLIALFGAQIASQVALLGETLPAAWDSLEARLSQSPWWDHAKQLASTSRGSGSGFGGIGQMIMSVSSGIADAIIVLFAGIFLAAQPRFYRTGAIKLVPPAKRALISTAMDDSERALRLWLKGQLISMTIVGFLTGLGLWLLGLKGALALGLLAGLLEFIPFAGPILASIPGILLALAVSPELALWVALLYFLVQQAEGALVQPMVQQYAVDLPGVVLLFSLIGFGMIFGTLGIILAAPLAVVTYVLVKRLYVQETLGTKTPIPGEGKD